MSMPFSLPPHLKLKLDLLRRDPEFQALLLAIPAPHQPLYKLSPSADLQADNQKDDWVFSSGRVAGHRRLLAIFGVDYKETENRD